MSRVYQSSLNQRAIRSVQPSRRTLLRRIPGHRAERLELRKPRKKSLTWGRGSICVNQIDEIGQTGGQIDRKRHCEVTKFGDLTKGACDKALRTTFMKLHTGSAILVLLKFDASKMRENPAISDWVRI